jgi:hypothetical protein
MGRPRGEIRVPNRLRPAEAVKRVCGNSLASDQPANPLGLHGLRRRLTRTVLGITRRLGPPLSLFADNSIRRPNERGMQRPPTLF